jgi:hypothetical protein
MVLIIGRKIQPTNENTIALLAASDEIGVGGNP